MAFPGSVPALSQLVDVRLDWYTSGQVRLWADGRLVAYHNNVGAGGVLQLDRVTFGLPFPEPEEFHRLSRRFSGNRVFVRALARPDTLALGTLREWRLAYRKSARRSSRGKPGTDPLMH